MCRPQILTPCEDMVLSYIYMVGIVVGETNSGNKNGVRNPFNFPISIHHKLSQMQIGKPLIPSNSETNNRFFDTDTNFKFGSKL